MLSGLFYSMGYIDNLTVLGISVDDYYAHLGDQAVSNMK